MSQKLDIKKVKEFEQSERVLYASGEDATGSMKWFYIKLNTGPGSKRYIVDSKHREGRAFELILSAVRFYNSL